MKKCITLIGMMGSGKTTVAQIISSKTMVKYTDLDEMIELKTGQSVEALITLYGMESFRAIEAKILKQHLSQSRQDEIFSLGGGTLCTESIHPFLQEHCYCIFLRTTPKTLTTRIQHELQQRPLLTGLTEKELEKKLQQIANDRQEYSRLANWFLDTDDYSAHEVAEQICAHIREIR